MNTADHERVSLSGSEQGSRPSSKGFYGLGESSNPYAKYATSDDGDSLDDGINMDDRLENGDCQDPDQMPPEDFVLREFHDYMEVMSPMSEPETLALRRTSLVEKWSLVYNQQCRSPIFPLRHYVSSLRRNSDSRRRTFSWSRGSTDKDGVSKLAHLLRKLKADMKLSPLSFIDEFVEKSNDGVKMLLKVLAEIQADKNSASASRKQKSDEYKRAVTEENDCLLCLKFAQRSQVGVIRFLQLDGAVDAIVSVIYGENIKSLAVALDILQNICGVGGASVVLEALAEYSMKHGEFLRFKPLVAKLKTDSDDQIIYSLSFMKLVNQLRAQEPDAEGVVAMQHELRQAGFELSAMHKLAQHVSVFGRDIQKEIEIWDKGSIRVNEYADEIMNLESRNRMFREEIDHLQSEVKEASNKLDIVKQENNNLQKKSEDNYSKASELSETLEKIESNNAHSPTQNLEKDEPKQSDAPSMERFTAFRSSLKKSASSSPDDAMSLSSFDSSVSIPDAPPPPAPIPPKLLPNNNKNNNLPILHWTPLYNVMGTVFQNVDNKLIQDGDFSEFEEKFKVEKVPEKLVRKLSDDSARINIIDTNRAKNLLITLRKIGKSPDEICQAIDDCNSNVLSGEDVELLSKFIPTKEEVNQMIHHKDDLSHMGEADQFIFQMAKIERLNSKMAVLVTMGSLTQQLRLLKPKIDHVNESVISVKQNKKLQKILEIVLIFGNYMNSGKKGYAMGFKLESLEKLNFIKGKDNLSFMQYLVDFLKRKFPNVVDFHKDLNFSPESFQAIQTEFQEIKKNIDMVRYEKGLQPGNEELQKFAVIANKEMAEVGDHFKRMEASYKEVCNMFGEDCKENAESDVLAHINDFAESFKKALHEQPAEEGHRKTSDRTAPSTPMSPRNPAAAIAAMLQQSQKFNERAELARRESSDDLEKMAKDEDPKGTLRRKSKAPQPPPVLINGNLSLSGSSNPPSLQSSPLIRPKRESVDRPETLVIPTAKGSPLICVEAPADSTKQSVMQRASLFSSMDNTPPTGRTAPVYTKTSPNATGIPAQSTVPERNNSPILSQSKTSPPSTNNRSSLNAVDLNKRPVSMPPNSSVGTKSPPAVSPKPVLKSVNSTFKSSQDDKSSSSQTKVSPIVRSAAAGYNQTTPTTSPGLKMVFPAKVPLQNSTVYKSPVENRNSTTSTGLNATSKSSPKGSRAPEPPIKVTPTFSKTFPSPNLSNVLPNKTSPANLNRKLQKSDAVTSPNGSGTSSPLANNSPRSANGSPSGNVKGLMRSFSGDEKSPEQTSQPVQRRNSPPAQNPPSPSQPTTAQKSPVSTSGKVIRNNSILFSAKSPSSFGSNESSPVTPPNRLKPRVTSSTSTPSSASSSRRTSIDENHNQDVKSVKDLRKDYERKSSTSSDIVKTMNELDNVLQQAGVAEETVDSYL